jgi:hypothetical protein
LSPQTTLVVVVAAVVVVVVAAAAAVVDLLFADLDALLRCHPQQ